MSPDIIDIFPRFKGKLKKIRLVSSNLGYGPIPAPDEEVEQRLTLNDKGQVWLSRYCFGNAENRLQLIEKCTFKVSSDVADIILCTISEYFSSDYCIPPVADGGGWHLTLTNTTGRKFSIKGPLVPHPFIGDEKLSELLRVHLGRNDLFAFDGNPDRVDRIEIHYHRNTKMKPGTPLPDSKAEYIIRDYHEDLIIDRETETVDHISWISPECRVSKQYHVEGGVESFLDEMDEYAFSEITGNPPDTVYDPLESKDYEIILTTKNGKRRVVTGTYDKNALPTDWPEFIESLYEFLSCYSFSELFHESNYNRPRRRESDYIFCNVEFGYGGQTYSYLADTDDYHEGDYVIVPVGPDNLETVAQIESIEYHPAEEAPYPLDRIKHIIRKK